MNQSGPIGVVRWTAIGISLVLGIASAGYAGPSDEDDWNAEQWAQALLDRRAERSKAFPASPTTYLAGIEHFRHDARTPVYVGVTSSGIAYSDEAGPESELVLEPQGNAWAWQPLQTSKAAASFRGEVKEPGKLLTGMVIDLGRYTLQVWRHEGRLELGVFDSERDVLKAYKGLYFFEPDEAFRVSGQFERFPTAETVTMLTAGSGEREFIRYGLVRFSIKDQPQQLTVYKNSPSSSLLFIPFRDKTSGKMTYGAGRYLNAEEPAGDSMTLDLNHAENFPCAYAPAFHCPIPPRENWLAVAVEAGELDYPLPE